MQPYFRLETLCWGVGAVRLKILCGGRVIILLGVGVDSYEAFWPEGARATWFEYYLFSTHTYEITDERDDLANHSLFFWTAVALRLPFLLTFLTMSFCNEAAV